MNQNHKLGTATGIASILGLMLIASSLLTITQGININAPIFFIALIISYLLMMCQSTSFAELASFIPTEGAVYDYVTAGMGRFWGITATLAAYVIVTCFASSAEVAAAGLFAQANFPFLNFIPVEQSYIIGWVIVLICILINIRGLEVFAVSENIMSYFKYTVLLVLGLIGLVIAPKVDTSNFWAGFDIAKDWMSILSMIGFTLFLFVGAEYVTPLAPEMKDPNKNIPQSLFGGLTLALVGMLIFGAGIVRQVPNVIVDEATQTTLLDTPDASLAFGEAVLGNVGKWGFILLIFVATVALINMLIASIPRILQGMAKDKMLPAIFAKEHPKYKTPYVGIIFIGLIPMIGSFLMGTNIDGVFQLILAAICSWIFFYLLVNISVILLRRRRPDIHRPFKTPCYPLPQLLAIVGLFITFFFLTPPFLKASQIYIPFFIMLAICAIYAFIWLKRMKVDLWKPVEPEEILSP